MYNNHQALARSLGENTLEQLRPAAGDARTLTLHGHEGEGWDALVSH
jgi:hypothetical protein